MKKLVLSFCLLLSVYGFTFAQTSINQLPPGSVIIEKVRLAEASRRNRTLVLWMKKPTKHPTGYKSDEPYTCPDYTRGSYYAGPAFVSLIESSSGKIINTIAIASDEDSNGSVDIPYSIRKGFYYRVKGNTSSRVEAKPVLLWLKDYNGDGKALEFALFNAEACMGLETTLIGYSEKSDRVVQYPIVISSTDGHGASKTKTFWADYLFAKKPIQPGHWKYEIDYSGRGGQLEKWDVRYNSQKEQFDGTFSSVSK